MLPLGFVSNKSPTHEYDYEIYSSNSKEDRVNQVRHSIATSRSLRHHNHIFFKNLIYFGTGG